MFHELPAGDYSAAADLFHTKRPHTSLPAMLAGNVRGAIYVDDVIRPRSGFMQAADMLYLAGSGRNPDFNLALAEAIPRRILQDLRAIDTHEFEVELLDPSWHNSLEDLFQGRSLEFGHGVLWAFEKSRLEAPSKLPDHLNLARIDSAFLERTDIDGVASIRALISHYWVSVERFFAQGLGVVLLDEASHRIITQCVAVFAAGEVCEPDIVTRPGDRLKGYGTIVARAFVERCLAEGITPGWECSSENIGSIRIATAVGFRQAMEVDTYIFRF